MSEYMKLFGHILYGGCDASSRFWTLNVRYVVYGSLYCPLSIVLDYIYFFDVLNDITRIGLLGHQQEFCSTLD
jgi:hypothetical protein